ncbi:hypothetical protein Tco_0079843 [Tanacetum coccineum]
MFSSAVSGRCSSPLANGCSICGGRISVGRIDGGSIGCVGVRSNLSNLWLYNASISAGTKSSGVKLKNEHWYIESSSFPWDQYITKKEVCLTQQLSGKPASKGSSRRYSKIVPQSGQKYR